MASKISVLIDVAVDGANKSLKSFRQSISDAEGSVGKFKAGAASAMDSIKANAGTLAMAGGAALIGFGVKAVAAFQDTALEAGKLSDSLGVTAEEASRLMEVAEDLGIGTEVLEKSIGIMNRTASNTPAAFAAIGAELVKNADGTTNVNETFLSTIEALNQIPDASDRAAAAQKVFGRGWMEMSELIGMGADGVRDALASVEGGKVIDEAEVAKARKLRDALDALKGVSEELAIEVGGALAPALSSAAGNATAMLRVLDRLGLMDLAAKFQEATSAAGYLDRGIGLVTGETDLWGRSVTTLTAAQIDQIKAAKDQGATTAELNELVASFTATQDGATEATNDYVSIAEDAAASAEAQAEAEKAAREALDRKAEALDRARERQEAATNATLAAIDSSLGYRNAQASASESLATYAEKAANGETSTTDLSAAQRDAEGAALAQAAAAVQLAEDQAAASGATLDSEAKARIFKEELERLAGFMSGDLLAAVQAYIAELGRIPASKTTNVAFSSTSGGTNSSSIRRFHGGGFADGESFANLKPDEVPAILQKGEAVLTPEQQAATASAGGGGGGININGNVILPNVKTPEDFVRDLREYVRRNGPIQGIT